MRNLFLRPTGSRSVMLGNVVTAFYFDYYKKDLEVFEFDSNEPFPLDAIGADDRVFLVGITPDPETFVKIYETAGDIIWIDNNMEAVQAIESLSDDDHPYSAVKGLRKPDQALCELVWNSYFGWVRNPPLILGLLGRYEMNDTDNPEWETRILPFNKGFEDHSVDPLDRENFEEFWKVILCLRRDPEVEHNMIEDIIAKGRTDND